MFSVGAKIVHPMHGAGTIQKIEEKEILGVVKRYYILKLPCNDMSVMIPVDAEASVGIREIVDESVIENAVIMPSTLINKNVKIKNAVIDRYAIITHIKELKGTEDEPIYVKRRDRI